MIDNYFLYDGDESLINSLSNDDTIKDILPLNDLSSARDNNELQSDVVTLMKQKFGDGSNYTCLDIIKIFLGVNTDRIEFKMFVQNPYYGKYKDTEYTVLIEKVEQIYQEQAGEIEYLPKRRTS